ncbi:MAG: energy transducer TonB [Gammaproteobacteria bacterium]
MLFSLTAGSGIRRLKVLGWRIASLLLVLGLHVMVLASILVGPARGPALDLPEAPIVTVALIESAPEPVPSPTEVVTGLPKAVKTVKPKPKPKKKILPDPRLTGSEVPAPKVPLQATEEVQASLRPATAATSHGQQAPAIPPDLSAAYRNNPAPPYPQICRDRGQQGKVVLLVRIAADGRAVLVEIATSSGYQRLDATAREAVSRWKFVPARQRGEPVAATVMVPVVFHLDG